MGGQVKMQWSDEPSEPGVPRRRRAAPGARLPQPGSDRPVFNFPFPLTPNVLLKASSRGRKKNKDLGAPFAEVSSLQRAFCLANPTSTILFNPDAAAL